MSISFALAALCALGSALVLSGSHSALRSYVVVVALVVGTGWAATVWIDITDAAYAATITLAVGLSFMFFFALFFVEIHWWHPVGSIGLLLAITAVPSLAAGAREAVLRRKA
jgi:hypothetical protein